MSHVVVRRTFGPDAVPQGRSERALSTEVIATGETVREAELLAKRHASEFPASGYNRQKDYWWGRDSEFRYTFTVEGPHRSPPGELQQP